jgi:hypothetical protein
LFGGEIFDAHHAKGAGDVAEIGLRDLIRSRPCGQDAGSGIVLLQKICGLAVNGDGVAIREIVFGRKAVRRIPEKAGDEGEADGAHQPAPIWDPAPQGGDGENDN